MTTTLNNQLITTNGIYDIHIPENSYSMFVKQNNFKSSMLLGYDKVGDITGCFRPARTCRTCCLSRTAFPRGCPRPKVGHCPNSVRPSV